MATATMTSKGQITIPIETRERLRLVPGVKVEFVENEHGDIVVRPKTVDIRTLRGCIRYDGPRVTLAQMDQAVESALRAESAPKRR
jgi:AbrB family looped-hinge helix DNA binding protein